MRSMSSVATQKMFETEIKICGLLEFAKVSLILSCKLSYLHRSLQRHFLQIESNITLTSFQ